MHSFSVLFCYLLATTISVTQCSRDVTGMALTDTGREKRSMVYINVPLAAFSVAVSVPFSVPGRPFQLSWGFQVAYFLPSNATDWTIGFRERRDASALTSFQELEDLLEENGFHGKQCLLRSICELAEMPLDWNGLGMLEEILQAILTPSKSIESSEIHKLRPYNQEVFEEAMLLEAENRGLQGEDCIINYPECDQSPLDMISEKFLEQ